MKFWSRVLWNKDIGSVLTKLQLNNDKQQLLTISIMLVVFLLLICKFKLSKGNTVKMKKYIRSKILSALYKIAKHYIFMITVMVASLGGAMIGMYTCFSSEIEKAAPEIIMILFSNVFFFILSMAAMMALSIREFNLNQNMEIILICLTEVLVVFNILYKIPWESAIACMVICDVFKRIYEK